MDTTQQHASESEHRSISGLEIAVVVVVALAVVTVLTIAAGGPWVPLAVVGGGGAFVAIVYLDHKINDGTAGGWNAGSGSGFGGGDGGGC